MSRYSDIKQRIAVDGYRYIANPIYPELEDNENDLYVIATEGARYDLLAQQFYGQMNYWWILAAVNSSEHADSLYIEPGTQLRIPPDPEAYIREYKALNS